MTSSLSETICRSSAGTCYGQPAYQIWSVRVHPLRRYKGQYKMYKLGCFGELGVTQGHRNVCIRSSAHDFLFDWNRNYAYILYSFLHAEMFWFVRTISRRSRTLGVTLIWLNSCTVVSADRTSPPDSWSISTGLMIHLHQTPGPSPPDARAGSGPGWCCGSRRRRRRRRRQSGSCLEVGTPRRERQLRPLNRADCYPLDEQRNRRPSPLYSWPSARSLNVQRRSSDLGRSTSKIIFLSFQSDMLYNVRPSIRLSVCL